jgi:hypothetical protein
MDKNLLNVEKDFQRSNTPKKLKTESTPNQVKLLIAT